MRRIISNADQLIRLALKEDVGRRDLTSRLLIRPTARAEGSIVAKEGGIVCGIPVARRVYQLIGSHVRFRALVEDGALIKKGETIARVRGLARGILAGERTALNFLSRLSGIATLTRRYVGAVEGTAAKILDTRKTTPGWRALEKYAVRVGGGTNHRMGLWDALLVKENHFRILAGQREAPLKDRHLIRRVTEHLKKRVSSRLLLEVEVETLEEFKGALEARPRVILLDNMLLEDICEAVRLARTSGSLRRRILLEVSGNVRLENVRAIAESGVDRISVGALTHSAPSLDLSLEVG